MKGIKNIIKYFALILLDGYFLLYILLALLKWLKNITICICKYDYCKCQKENTF